MVLFHFLVARLVVKPLTGYYDKYNDSYYGLDFNNEQIIWSIFVTLFLGLLFLFLGYCFVKDDEQKEIKRLKGMVQKYKILHL